MTRRLTTATSILGFCLILSNTAFAQIQDHLELNLFGAGSLYSSNKYQIGYPQSLTPIPGEIKLDEAVRFGARVGVYTRGHWGQEFYYSFENNGVRIANGGVAPTVTDFRVRVHNYGVNALYYFTETESNAFQPFASAGLGGTAYQIRQESLIALRDPARGNLPDVNNSNELAFNYGFGFKTRSGPVGVRLDIRDFVARTPSFGLVRQSIDPTATVLPATGVFHNVELSLGLTFYFGRR
jgi:hypothetical protein